MNRRLPVIWGVRQTVLGIMPRPSCGWSLEGADSSTTLYKILTVEHYQRAIVHRFEDVRGRQTSYDGGQYNFCGYTPVTWSTFLEQCKIQQADNIYVVAPLCVWMLGLALKCALGLGSWHVRAHT